MQSHWIETSSGRIAILARPRGGDWLERDVLDWRRGGIDVVVSLLTPDEAREFDLEREEKTVGDQGMDYKSFPIPDRGIPPSIAGFLELLRVLHLEIEQGKTIGVHCRQGIGRSGLLAAGILMAGGEEIRSAIEKISRTRGIEIPETEEQRDWLIRLSKSKAPVLPIASKPV